MRQLLRWTLAAWLAFAVSPTLGQVLVLKNGMELRGKIAPLESIGGQALEPGGAAVSGLQLLILVDNGLTRTYVSTYQKHNLLADVDHFEQITLKQPVSQVGRHVGKLGSILKVGPFNHLGHRAVTIQSDKGPVTILQGITEITPLWTKLEALEARPAVQWDSRIATSSIPRQTLAEVLRNHLPSDSADSKLSIVRLLIDAERYTDAEDQLRDTLREFPNLKDLNKQLTELQQLKARQYIKEIRNLQNAGRHRQAWSLLKNFPTENVAGQILAEVSGMLTDYEKQSERVQKIMERFTTEAETLVDENQKRLFSVVLDECLAELQFNAMINTRDRLIDFERLADDPTVTSEQKVALAVSGWILGSGAATDNIGVAMSLVDVRELVIQYLATDPNDEQTRKRILSQLTSYEGSDPARISKLVANLKPPIATPELAPPTDDNLNQDDTAPATPAPTPAPTPDAPLADAAPADRPPGFARLSITGLHDMEKFEYVVQLPPEYDPHRKYPAIVTLHSAGSTPEMQINWWAGDFNSERGQRLGQATRHGYIVIAPAWSEPTQNRYAYSAREHAAVLFTLRDAMKRFAIDTDRVFLSGLSMGADAAWDIGLSHPDLWAGVLPIVAAAYQEGEKSARYIPLYWRNGRGVPFYFVTGSMDGERTQRNSTDWDRYLSDSHFDVMVTEYIGRGHEHYMDDIHRMFQWMANHRRNFYPKEIVATTMRGSDNFFWWLEFDRFPERFLLGPMDWPVKGRLGQPTEAELRSKNYFVVKTPAEQMTLWLSPDIVDFNEPVRLSVGGRNVSEKLAPDLATLLEDIRTRGDRQHPFWAKLTIELKRADR